MEKAMSVRFCTLLVLTVACNAPTNGFDVDDLIALGTGFQPGVIKLRDEVVVIEVPAAGRVGDTIPISIRTYGVSCGIEKGETRISIEGRRVTIAPFDEVKERKDVYVCAAILRFFLHEAPIVFKRSGDVDVEIRGRELPSNQPFIRTFTVAIR